MATVHKCVECKYETPDVSNFERHQKSLKHISIATNINKYACTDCNAKFKHKNNLYRHKKTSCQNKNYKQNAELEDKLELVKLTVDENVLEKIKNLEQELMTEKLNRKNDEIKHLRAEMMMKDEMLQDKDKQITNLNKIVTTAGKVVDKTNKNMGKSLDVVKYLSETYPNAPPLKAIPLEKYKELAANNYSFCYTFIHYFRKNELADHIAEFVIAICKKADIAQNSMCIKDLTRDSFYYVNADGKWCYDKQGQNIQLILLQPIFDLAKIKMTAHNEIQNKKTRNMKLCSSEMDKYRLNNEDGVKIIDQIKNGKLGKNVMKRIGVQFILQCGEKEDGKKIKSVVDAMSEAEIEAEKNDDIDIISESESPIIKPLNKKNNPVVKAKKLKV